MFQGACPLTYLAHRAIIHETFGRVNEFHDSLGLFRRNFLNCTHPTLCNQVGFRRRSSLYQTIRRRALAEVNPESHRWQ